MGRQRGSVALRWIEDRRRRGICFLKRRAGLVKKAEELAVLCDAEVGLLVLNPFDGTFHCFAAPATMDNIIERYQNFSAVERHNRILFEESKSKEFQVHSTTTDKGPSIDDKPNDESNISQLTIDQLSQIQRKFEHALRNIMARKLDADRIARLQEKGKIVNEERNFMEMVFGKEKRQEGGRYGTGSQQNDGKVDVTLSLSLNIGISIGQDGGGLHGHQMPIDLNMP